MGKNRKAHADGIKRKVDSYANVVTDGFDQALEDEARAMNADDELRPYYVDRFLGERQAAARQAAARQAAARQAAASTAVSLAPPADEVVPPADAAAAAAAVDPPADAEVQAPPAE